MGQAGKNKVINGAMQVWQRGTTATTTGAGYYTADRWASFMPTGSGTMSQETTTLPTGFRYGMKFTASATATCNYYNTIETAITIPLVGQTVTLSIYAWGTAGNTLALQLRESSTVDQGFTGAFTTILNSPITLTTTPTRYSATVTIPSTTKTLQIVTGTSSTIANGTFISFTGVQLEAGSIATPFQTASGGSIQGELAMCQRYYFRTSPGAAQRVFGTGFNQQTTLATALVVFPVEMRIRPTALEQSGTAADYAIGHGNGTETALNGVPTFGGYTTNRGGTVSGTVASGLTAGQGNYFIANGSAGYLGWSAEL
jgi:hypothetical protein